LKTKKRSSKVGGSQRLLNIREVPSEVHIAEEGDLLDQEEAALVIWKEALFGAELLLLLTSPVYFGFGVPRGDGSAVILLPGFLGSDHYLGQMGSWLTRIGYRPYLSGIRINAECPNLLIQHRLTETIKTALDATGKKVHLIGHSLGGVIARSIAGQRPEDVSSVITLASPFRGTIAHHSILRAAESVRRHIHEQHGKDVLPGCYTTRCTCAFLKSLRRRVPCSVMETAIYTLDDGVVDSRCCRTGCSDNDFEVPGTHIGLAFNSSAYNIIARRLAEARGLD
jgi:pimeloyl-ACP methyl ester carboxylesterase